jgi:hypothetical protein
MKHTKIVADKEHIENNYVAGKLWQYVFHSLESKIFLQIIKFIRLPIWILVLLTTLHHRKDLPDIMFWNGLLTSVLMIGLDSYWEGKCDKVINEYKLNH